jgi:hypothetical protein
MVSAANPRRIANRRSSPPLSSACAAEVVERAWRPAQVCEAGGQQHEGAGDGVVAPETVLRAHDVAVDLFVVRVECAGGFEELEGLFRVGVGGESR